MWKEKALQDWYVSKRTVERINPIKASNASAPVFGQYKIRRIFWLRSVWYQSSRKSERTICKVSTSFSNLHTYIDKILAIIAGVCWEKRLRVPKSANSNFWRWDNQWHYNYSRATFLLGAETRMHKNLSLPLVHSLEQFEQFCANRVSLLVVKETTIPTPVLLQKLWKCFHTVGMEIMDCSLHSITKFTLDKKTHAAINNEMFKQLGHIDGPLYHVELASHCRFLYPAVR